MTYTSESSTLPNFFDSLASKRDFWINKNHYYYQELTRLHKWLIEKNKSVLDIGCGTGNLLAAVSPKRGEGVDFSYEMIKIATEKYPQYRFKVMDAHQLEYTTTFDYVVMSNLVGYVDDIWQVFRSLRAVCHDRTRIVITNYNYFWQPFMWLGEKLGLKMPDKIQNWLPQEFVEHFLYLNGFEVVKRGKYLHLPFVIPLISNYVNSVLSVLFPFKYFGLIEYIVARPVFHKENTSKHTSVSIIVPTHEEAGNIERIISEVPQIGTYTELIFVDLPGQDGTKQKIKSQMKTYKGPLKIKYIEQTKKTGKVGALRLGVAESSGEIILIYDADATVPAMDLNKFYLALLEKKADLVNGTRLVYPTEKGAMRFFNHIGNFIFAKLFSWTLGQHFTDTLCGTKGFWKSDFKNLEMSQISFETKDRFGDFYLILGAFRRNLKIAEVPVRYKSRRYGDTKLDRFVNGWIYAKMFFAFFWYHVLLRRDNF